MAAMANGAGAAADLPFPYEHFAADLSQNDLRITAYEILVSVSRSSSGKPLNYISHTHANGCDDRLSSPTSTSPSLQRSITSMAAIKMKKAFGLTMSNHGSKKNMSSRDIICPPLVNRKPVTVGELIRVQMRVSEAVDSRVRNFLLRIAAGQVGKSVETIVLPLELLLQSRSSDFPDDEEFEAWRRRNLKLLEAGLILHPRKTLNKANTASLHLQKIICDILDRRLDNGHNNEPIQMLRSPVMALASRTIDGYEFDCHWADGNPLNFMLYEALLEACFDINNKSSMIEEIGELLEHIKKTWKILGMNHVLHNLCFLWVLFRHFLEIKQVDNDLLSVVNSQLLEVAKDAKTVQDPGYSKILISILNAIVGWVEKRLFAYHETFDNVNIYLMESIISMGMSSANVLVESSGYKKKRKGVVDVRRNMMDNYIRSSLRTAFAQRMEKADSRRRAHKDDITPIPVLAILAEDILELAKKEKEVFSPILKRWHPFAAGVAVATLHSCYGGEIRQFILGTAELTTESVQVLKAADKLEKELVQIAVEDSVESEDGGKAIIYEMPPYEAEAVIFKLVKGWIRGRSEKLKDWIDQTLDQELWNPEEPSKFGHSASSVNTLRRINETLDAYFHLPIPMHQVLLPQLVAALDICLTHYISKAQSDCGNKNTFLPTMPDLTRCATGTKFQWKKREKSQISAKMALHGTMGDVKGSSSSVPGLCIRINSLQHIWTELDVLEKRMKTLIRNSESAQIEDISNRVGQKFEKSAASSSEGIERLCETMGYKVVFHDLSPFLLNGLYMGSPSSSRIGPFIHQLEFRLLTISENLHERSRKHAVMDIMRASFDGFLLVLLCGGPHRAFSQKDYQVIADDFQSLKGVFSSSGGDGVHIEMLEKLSNTISDVLPFFCADTGSLIQRLRRERSSPAKVKPPLPLASGQWNAGESDTILHVLCHRNDATASKFLKKAYGLPNK